MAHEIEFTADASKVKTYATRENVRKAIAKLPAIANNDKLRYFIQSMDDGRFIPVFVGESAIQAGVHFHFHVVG